MKKILTCVAAATLLTAGVFAVDFSATVKAEMDVFAGSINEDEGNKWGVFGSENTTQQDNDLLVVNFNGDRGGATFKLWSTVKAHTDESLTTSGDSDELLPLAIRGLKVWFNPIDWMTVSVGNVGLTLPFIEQIDWWKVPFGSSLAQFNGWDGKWNSSYVNDGYTGFTVEMNNPFGLNGLYLGFGFVPDIDNYAFTTDNTTDGWSAQGDNFNYRSWGAVGTYAIGDTGVTVGVGYRDDGNGSIYYANMLRRLTIGAQAYLGSFHGFVDAMLYFDNALGSYGGGSREDITLTGICIDNYFDYTLPNGIGLKLTAPITIRGISNFDGEDPSYMTWKFRVSIPVNPVTINVTVGSDASPWTTSLSNNAYNGGDSYNAWRFDDNFNLTLGGAVSVSFNVGVASISTGLEVGYINKYTHSEGHAYDGTGKSSFSWSIPVVTTIAF